MLVLRLNQSKSLAYRLINIKYRSRLTLLNRSYSIGINDLIIKHLESPFAKTPTNDVYEQFWYNVWEQSNFFTIDSNNSSTFNDKCSNFSMILPPPNITGNLHMGHAATIAIEDAIFRYQKLQNPQSNSIFIPGYDHAGIGMFSVLDRFTQSKFNKRIHECNKDEFNELTINWKEERISTIREQLKTLGASLNFTNEKFTMDEQMCKSVREAIIRLHDQGLIYRDCLNSELFCSEVIVQEYNYCYIPTIDLFPKVLPVT